MKSTNICFIANFTKTYFFNEISNNLAKHGVNVFWITTNRKLFNYLAREYGAESVLLINRKYIQQTEATINDFKINELIFGDRVLRYEPMNGQKYLTNIQRPIYNFLKEKEISFVFGEITWSHEILIYRMCSQQKELNCEYLNPHVVRIPDRRFAFFTDERQSILKPIKKIETASDSFKLKKPEYLKRNDQIMARANSIKGRISRIKRWLTNENIDKEDPTHLTNGTDRFKLKSQEELYKEAYKLIKRDSFETFIEDDYVFIGLHKQPEASVDVLGRYYEDQFLNISNLWRALPKGWKILVKEHTNAIGDRSPAFYKKIQSLPNVHLIDEKTDSYEVINNAKLVATITGTIAYEAALLRVPSITFAPVFFNGFSTCRQITLEDLSKYQLNEIANELRLLPDNRKEVSSFILSGSHEGIFTDPVSNDQVMEPENVSKVSEAFLSLFHYEDNQEQKAGRTFKNIHS